ncbi:MAG TPA: hypothetical protein VGG91_21240 [Myxococcaceae bacterium]|jgi:hypothetical protein
MLSLALMLTLAAEPLVVSSDTGAKVVLFPGDTLQTSGSGTVLAVIQDPGAQPITLEARGDGNVYLVGHGDLDHVIVRKTGRGTVYFFTRRSRKPPAGDVEKASALRLWWVGMRMRNAPTVKHQRLATN